MAAELEEREWIRLSREGETEAFTELVRLHQRMIHALTYRMTGSLADAEDLAQESFIRAWHSLESFQGNAKFSTWLCRIAMNACLNWRKREGHRDQVHQTWADNSSGETHATATHDSSNHLSSCVQAALDRLPPSQRAAIVLTVYHELSHAEAARVLGCTEPTISWRIFAARKKLKRWLEKDGSHE